MIKIFKLFKSVAKPKIFNTFILAETAKYGNRRWRIGFSSIRQDLLEGRQEQAYNKMMTLMRNNCIPDFAQSCYVSVSQVAKDFPDEAKVKMWLEYVDLFGPDVEQSKILGKRCFRLVGAASIADFFEKKYEGNDKDAETTGRLKKIEEMFVEIIRES